MKEYEKALQLGVYVTYRSGMPGYYGTFKYKKEIEHYKLYGTRTPTPPG